MAWDGAGEANQLRVIVKAETREECREEAHSWGVRAAGCSKWGSGEGPKLGAPR